MLTSFDSKCIWVLTNGSRNPEEPVWSVLGISILSIGFQGNMGIDESMLLHLRMLGNRKPRGLKCTWGDGHSPSDFTKHFGFCKNFRVDSDRLRCDFHGWEPSRMSPYFPRDPIDHMFRVVRNDPFDQFISPVFYQSGNRVTSFSHLQFVSYPTEYYRDVR